MFVSYAAAAIIVAGAAGLGFGSPDISDLIYAVQASMLFAGIACTVRMSMPFAAIATLVRSVPLAPVGPRLPRWCKAIAELCAMAAPMGGIVIGGAVRPTRSAALRLRGELRDLAAGRAAARRLPARARGALPR